MEERLARIEAKLGLDSPVDAAPAGNEGGSARSGDAFPPGAVRIQDEAGRQVGQNGFAMAGVLTLTIGIGYMLLQPYPGLPAATPAALGATLAAGLLLAAHLGQRGFGAIAAPVRGAAMVLLYLAALRLYFFARPPAVVLDSFSGRAMPVLAVAINAFVAWRHRSFWLVLLALAMGCATLIAIDSGGLLAGALPSLAVIVVAAARRQGWPTLPLAAIPLLCATYAVWAVGNPLRGGRFRYVGEPPVAPGLLLVTAAVFAAGCLFRRHRDHEDGVSNTQALLTVILGYGCFLVHSAAAFPRSFAALQTAAFVVFLGVAALFWSREQSRVSTFLYAMTGYAALSMAILKSAPVPEIYVLLSLQSVVVLATAIWFRSRAIVVANFLIFAAILSGYMTLTRHENGISLGFGLVALVSARILNWQKDRLELKTGAMRNAYLTSAFIVFPYALYHLVPSRFIALAWIGLAAGYYLLGRIGRNRKYRWMGHGTLGLVAGFLLLAGGDRLGPIYRVASFLALGTLLLIVSRSFARVDGIRTPGETR